LLEEDASRRLVNGALATARPCRTNDKKSNRFAIGMRAGMDRRRRDRPIAAKGMLLANCGEAPGG